MTNRVWLWRLLGLLVLLVAISVVALLIGLPSHAELHSWLEGFRELGGWAAPLFVAVYVVAALSPLPKPVFTLAAGGLFGVVEGLPLVLLGATAGAVLAFFLGRVLGRDGVQHLAGVGLERLDDRLTRHGLLAIVTLRLVPVVPYTALNYGAGLTAVRLRDFILGTVLGILPGTTAYVVLGASSRHPGSWPAISALAVLLVLIGVSLGVARRRRRRRRPALSGRPGDDASRAGSE